MKGQFTSDTSQTSSTQDVAVTEGSSLGADDVTLIQRIAKQDRLAFDVLYARYQRRVFRFVARKVRSDALAEEIVSDVMLAVWRGAGSFEGNSTVSTWLLGIAYRQTLRALNRDRKHSIVDSDEELVAVVADLTVSRPEPRAMAANDRSILRRGVESLSKHHRDVVELTANGHSYSEIAGIVGVCENTVRTRMFHARQQLKRFLARVGSDALALCSGKARRQAADDRSADRDFPADVTTAFS
jgi:RNA polymerase sigma-70 factor, ECF subfamily